MAEKQINVLWKAYFVDRQVREAVSAIFREPDAALVRMIVKRTQDLQHGEVRDPLRRADLTARFPTTVSLQTPAPQTELQEPPATFKHDHRRAAVVRNGRTKVGELISAGVVSAPAEIEVTFKGQRLTPTIDAGGMIRNKVNGPPPDGRPYWSTNGWTFWHYKDPVTGHPEPISKWLEKLG